MKNTPIEHIIAENERRKAMAAADRYDQLTGEGCYGDRVEADGCRVPRAVLARCPDYLSLPPLERDRWRIQEDFEYWCVRCVTIKDKLSGRNVPLLLNRPQRRLLAVMEDQRTAGRPVRVILLKARQWGGSTLVQMYLAWMQLVRHQGWNSLICGHLHVTSKSIKRMYNLLLRHYPRDLLDGGRPRFTKLEGQPNVQQVEGRDCLVITASSRSEDAVRGYDIKMAHLSEVAFWQSSAMHSPDEVVRSVCGSVALEPETVIVLESTANGVGDYFHDEWLRAQMGRSDKQPVFVPWCEIDIYSHEVDDPEALWREMDEYEHTLWNDGCTLEQVNWYHHKRREYRRHEMMMAEYPTSASEAFATSGNHPFPREDLDRLEQGCAGGPLLEGDIQGDGMSGEAAKRNIHLVKSASGLSRRATWWLWTWAAGPTAATTRSSPCGAWPTAAANPLSRHNGAATSTTTNWRGRRCNWPSTTTTRCSSWRATRSPTRPRVRARAIISWRRCCTSMATCTAGSRGGWVSTPTARPSARPSRHSLLHCATTSMWNVTSRR